MGYEILTALVLLFLLVFNAKRGGGLSYPPALFAMVWFGVYLVNILLLLTGILDVWNFSYYLHLLVLSGVLAFMAGGEAARGRAGRLPRGKGLSIPIPVIPETVEKILLGVSVMAVPLFIRQASMITEVSPFFPEHPYKALRWALTYGGAAFGALAYLFPVLVVTVLVYLWKGQREGWSRLNLAALVLSILSALVVSVLMTGRTYPLLLLLIGLGWYLATATRVFKKLLAAGGLFLLLFLVIGSSLDKLDLLNQKKGIREGGALGGMGWYAVCGSHAMGQVLSFEQPRFPPFSFTTRFPHAILARLGVLDSEPPDLVLPEIAVPYSANVYTLYYPYLADDGFVYALLLLFTWGFLHSMLYFKARRGSVGCRYGYAMMLYPLVMSFFQEQYLSLLSTWIQFGLLYFLLKFFMTTVPPEGGMEKEAAHGDTST